MRGVTRKFVQKMRNRHISTHTPHARCDRCPCTMLAVMDISTHTPHARCDGVAVNPILYLAEFLLTHLMRGVTAKSIVPAAARLFLLTHLMRGVTLPRLSQGGVLKNFYSHTSCEV